MKIAITAYNNTDWLTDTDFIILNLTEDEIKEIKDLNKSLNTIFPNNYAEVHLYNKNYEVYSANVDPAYLSNEIIDWLHIDSEKRPEYIVLDDQHLHYESIPTSEDENDVRLDTHMLIITKEGFYCKCYTKYGSEEIYTQEININSINKYYNLLFIKV